MHERSCWGLCDRSVSSNKQRSPVVGVVLSGLTNSDRLWLVLCDRYKAGVSPSRSYR
ncbi:MAG TPA: hypothetical protein VK203_22410 [Nostocaceae cyanobacterium]|nr:hypothetical protein [Nostocaceae cyanobacterium]